MKTKYLIPILVVLITAQSCTIFSLNPLYTEEDLMEVPDLVGTWEEPDEHEYVSIELLQNNKYLFRYMEDLRKDGTFQEVDTVSYEAGFLEVGNHFFADLYPYYHDEGSDESEYLFRNFIPTHSILKIVKEGNELQLYLFNFDRLQELFEQNRIRIKHQMFDDYIVITASTEELQKFIEKYADDPKAFEDPAIFRKIE